jgi:hypothetical protein
MLSTWHRIDALLEPPNLDKDPKSFDEYTTWVGVSESSSEHPLNIPGPNNKMSFGPLLWICGSLSYNGDASIKSMGSVGSSLSPSHHVVMADVESKWLKWWWFLWDRE